MHYHIYSFCGQPGCKDKPYHENTENLVSPRLNGPEVMEFLKEHLIEDNDFCTDDTIVRLCTEKVCPNQGWFWVYIRRSNPLTLAFRPQHYSETDSFDRTTEVWYDNLWEAKEKYD